MYKMPEEIRKLTKLRHLLSYYTGLIQWKDIGGMTSLQEIPAVIIDDDGVVVIREVKKTIGISCMSEVIRSDHMPVRVAWPGVQLPSIGSDTFGIGNDDAVETEVDDDYVVDITITQGAWDLGPTQD